MNTAYDCKTFAKELPDLVLTPDARPSAAAVAHLRVCPPCAEEYTSFAETMGLLDAWKAPAPTPYFDQKLAVRLREEQAAPPMSWLERLETRLSLNTGRLFRPALAGALALALVAGGGSIVGLTSMHSATPATPQASATVEDLQILDRNEQAFQQLDELQQDEDSTPTPATSGPATGQPTS